MSEIIYMLEFSQCIYKSLYEINNQINIEKFFNGFRKSDEFRFFNNKKNTQIVRDVLRTERAGSMTIKEVIDLMEVKPDGYKDSYIYKSMVLFFFFFITQKEPALFHTDFLRKLYASSNRYYDVEDLADVPNAILFITIVKKKDFSFFKEQLQYWNEHKGEYSPVLKLRHTSSNIPYGEWKLKLSDGLDGDIENTQATRKSLEKINTDMVYWEGFEVYSKDAKATSLTRDLVELLLDSKNRRAYYFCKILNEIILAQADYSRKNKEDIFKPINKGYLVVDRLMHILNCCFDGTILERADGWALGDYSSRITDYSNSKTPVGDCINYYLTGNFDNDKANKQIQKIILKKYHDNASGGKRGKRKYLRAYMFGEYQDYRHEKDKEIIISKELLLMMILVCKLYDPDKLTSEDVLHLLYNSRYGRELPCNDFDTFFLESFGKLKELGLDSSMAERLIVLKSISAKYEVERLKKGKTMFADAILGRESRDGK